MPSNYAADTVLQAVSILVTMLSEKKKKTIWQLNFTNFTKGWLLNSKFLFCRIVNGSSTLTIIITLINCCLLDLCQSWVNPLSRTSAVTIVRQVNNKII